MLVGHYDLAVRRGQGIGFGDHPNACFSLAVGSMDIPRNEILDRLGCHAGQQRGAT